MPRTPTTPVQAQQRASDHAEKVRLAAGTIAAVLNGTYPCPDAERGDVIHAAAKVMEAAGCYIRRANADRLLVP